MVLRPASFVKAHWRDVVAEAKAVGEVVVTHHERPEAVVLSMARYQELIHEAAAADPLATLRADFDRELAVLREPGAAETLRRVFRATPAELAEAANEADLKRGV
ncbi:MAG TPA: prevent-host-death family protein [Thermoanaerobaculia bacterium]|nr:prevent-host-death family protein [Thermoanaerobaculia bacterium]